MAVNGGGSKQHFWPASIPPSLNRKDRQILAHAGFNFNSNSNSGSSQRSPKRHYQNQNNTNNNGNVNNQSMRYAVDFESRFVRGTATQQQQQQQQTSAVENTNNNNNSSKHQYLNMSSRSNDPWKMMKNHQNQINKKSCQLDKTNIFAVLKKQMSCPFVEASPPIQLFKEEDRNRLNALYSGARGLSVISSPAPLQTREDSSVTTAAGCGGSGDNSKCLTANNTTREEGGEGGVVATTQQSQSIESRG